MLTLLCCPVCRSALQLSEKIANESEIIEGELLCTSCDRSYLISNGVPRMVVDLVDRKELADSWGFQWIKKSEGKLEVDTSYGKTEEQELKSFLKTMEIASEDLQGKVVLDAGCGYGRLTRALGRCGAVVFGIDIASSIELIHEKSKHNQNVCIIQADMVDPPFPNSTFDYVWSNLSLCYAHQSERAFKNLSDLVKPSGKLFISVPDKDNPTFVVTLRQFFRIAHRIPTGLLLYTCWCLAPLLWLAKKVVRQERTSLRENVFFLFNSLHPPLMNCHTREEVLGWFERGGEFQQVMYTSVGGAIKVSGVKC